jgi:hypothetical protein
LNDQKTAGSTYLPPQDKLKWTELDAVLSDVLPRRFSSAWVRATPSARLATEFDNFIFEFFKVNCGLVDPVVPPPTAAINTKVSNAFGSRSRTAR